ncbi:MAG: hypothetical protein JXA30_21765 [Deltaproteobacteria bacterium]|nr:hypothetical protein [Deltaproteobacteria bacterium]
MEKTEIKIFDIMACNVYWDFENSRMPKETHKMLVALYPTPGVKAPDLIEKIRAFGPNGYEVAFANDKFNNTKLNGWFYTPELQNYWYMVNIPSGFLKEGEYTIEVTRKDGSVDTKSRVQKNAYADALVQAYKKNWDRIFDSFSPSRKKQLPKDSPRKNLKLSWSTMKDVAGMDAFYVTRVAQSSTPMEFDGNNLSFFDNIYIQRLRNNDADAGKNRGHVTIETELKPQTDYGYFVEITDANVGGEANICIFQPHQFFTTN